MISFIINFATNFVFIVCFLQNHPDVYKELTAKVPKSSTFAGKTDSDSQRSILSFTQPSPSTKKYKPSEPMQKALTDSVAVHVAECLLPLSHVDKPSFKRMWELGHPKWKPPCRQTLASTILPNINEELNKRLKSEFENTEYLSATLDLWTSRRMRSYVGITIHFIVNGKLESRSLRLTRFTGSHTAEKILEVYESVLKHFSILDKVYHIVTDNGSNVLKAFYSLPHMKENYEDDDDEDSENEDIDEDFAEINDTELHDFCTEWHPCICHTIQLVIKDGFKNATDINKVLAKCAKVVSNARKSTKATDIFDACGCKVLQKACPTRWNSQVKMIKSILCCDSGILDQLDKAPKLTSQDRKILSELVEILAPFESVTDQLQGEYYVSSSFVIPAILIVNDKLTELISNAKLCKTFIKNIDESWKRRMQRYLDCESYKIATVLDPRFKTSWFEDDQIDSARESLMEEYKKISPDDCDIPTNQPSPAKKARMDFFTKSMENRMQQRKSLLIPKKSEIDLYLNEMNSEFDDNPLEFWLSNRHRFPVLYKLSLRYLCIPASSAPVERLFSTAGKIFRAERANLSDNMFEMLTFIKLNHSKCN